MATFNIDDGPTPANIDAAVQEANRLLKWLHDNNVSVSVGDGGDHPFPEWNPCNPEATKLPAKVHSALHKFFMGLAPSNGCMCCAGARIAAALLIALVAAAFAIGSAGTVNSNTAGTVDQTTPPPSILNTQ